MRLPSSYGSFSRVRVSPRLGWALVAVTTLALTVGAQVNSAQAPADPQPAAAPTTAAPTPTQPATQPETQPQTQPGTPPATPAAAPTEPKPPATQPAPAAQQPSFRSGVDVVSLNVTVTDSTRNFVRNLNQEDFVVFEDGIKQDLTFFTKAQLPIALSLLIDTSASMEDKLGVAQEAAIGFAKRMRPDDIAQVDRLRQPRLDPPAVHQRQAGPRGGHPPDRAERLDLAAQRRLHLAERAEEGPCAEHRGGAAPGDRGALGRRRHLEPGAVRGGARARQALRGGHLQPSPFAAATSARAASTRPSSCCASSRRRPAAGRSSRRRPPSCRTSTARLPTSSPRSTRWPTRHATRSATASGAASSCARPSPRWWRVPSRVLRADQLADHGSLPTRLRRER